MRDQVKLHLSLHCKIIIIILLTIPGLNMQIHTDENKLFPAFPVQPPKMDQSNFSPAAWHRPSIGGETCDPSMVGEHPLAPLIKNPSLPLYRHCLQFPCNVAKMSHQRQHFNITNPQILGADLIHLWSTATTELLNSHSKLSPSDFASVTACVAQLLTCQQLSPASGVLKLTMH